MSQTKTDINCTDDVEQFSKQRHWINKAARRRARWNNFCYGAVIYLALLVSVSVSNAAEMLNVRHWAAPDHTRIVFDLDTESVYTFQQQENKLIVELADTSCNATIPAEMIVNKPGIHKIVFSSTAGKKVRIEFFLDKYLKTEVFKLKKFQNKPDRLVVDVILEAAPRDEAVKEQIPQIRQKKVIVIDPGHGGDDPGAIGRRGTYEKNIVLAIGWEMKKAINKMPGYHAILTRDGDYYVSFNKRLQIAKDANASLFISVHADAARNRNARGSSVYCLSTGAASNEAAKLLANNENLSDIIGGAPNGEGNNQSDQILLNMFQTNTINMSKTYASNLIGQLDQVGSLKHKSLQEAPFRVLKLLDIPAVLLETAYISNAQEESLLKTKTFQKKIAIAVASSVVTYLSGTASTALANDAIKSDAKADDRAGEMENNKKGAEELKEIKTISYRIKSKDTLFSVARKFNTKVSLLLKLNKMKLGDPIYVGRKMLVPEGPVANGHDASIAAEDQKNKMNGHKKPTRFYRVKKGDTLFSLAKSNSTTVEELMRINKMQNTGTLFSGQRILLPK